MNKKKIKKRIEREERKTGKLKTGKKDSVELKTGKTLKLNGKGTPCHQLQLDLDIC